MAVYRLDKKYNLSEMGAINNGKVEPEKFSNEFLTEATDPQDYRVVTVVMDVAIPARKNMREFGIGTTDPHSPIYNALSKALESVGLKMAGDFVDSEGEVTQIYKDNEYEFSFNESLKESTKGRTLQVEYIDKEGNEVVSHFLCDKNYFPVSKDNEQLVTAIKNTLNGVEDVISISE